MISTSLEVTQTVSDEMLASAVGSGDASVFATPMMIALMEKASLLCIAPLLNEGETSVGTTINVSHLSATPAGCHVRAVATVTAVDRKKITFHVEAYDDESLIGEGTHERFVVDRVKFEQKANQKLNR